MDLIINFFESHQQIIMDIISVIIQFFIFISVYFYTRTTFKLLKENSKIRLVQEKMYRLIFFKDCFNLSDFSKELLRNNNNIQQIVLDIKEEEQNKLFSIMENDITNVYKELEEMKLNNTIN